MRSYEQRFGGFYTVLRVQRAAFGPFVVLTPSQGADHVLSMPLDAARALVRSRFSVGQEIWLPIEVNLL